MVTLIRRGDVADLASETREVTVLFTDIVGFTSRTERMGAEATAAFLRLEVALEQLDLDSGQVDVKADAIDAEQREGDQHPPAELRNPEDIGENLEKGAHQTVIASPPCSSI